MRFYKNRHRYYCGIDLHAKTMYVCVIDSEGAVVKHRNISCNPGAFLSAIALFREDIVVAVECVFCWYWLADVCAKEKIPFVLGHALYMKAIHGSKAKNDKIDSEKIALLLRAGMMPQAYVYPQEMRATRDLMRRRLFFVRRRAELLAHVQMTFQQYNCTAPVGDLTYAKNRDALVLPFSDPAVVRAVQCDLTMVGHLTKMVDQLEHYIDALRFEKEDIGLKLALLRSVPGIGRVLSATILYEIEDINRFPSVQDFISYCRLIKPKKTSAGKTVAGGGKKIGNHHLRWAFSEAVMIHLRDDAQGKCYMQQLLKRHPKGKAMSILAAKLARSVYFILKREQSFDAKKFFAMAA
jgi:transposase